MDEVLGMTEGLEILVLDEHDTDRATVKDGIQRWHAFDVLARRPNVA